MNIIALIIQLIAGAIGGNIAGAALKDYNLGTIGNSIAGIIGGGIGGQILAALLGGAGMSATAAATSGGGISIGSIIGDLAGGGIGGAILMVIVGLIHKARENEAPGPQSAALGTRWLTAPAPYLPQRLRSGQEDPVSRKFSGRQPSTTASTTARWICSLRTRTIARIPKSIGRPLDRSSAPCAPADPLPRRTYRFRSRSTLACSRCQSRCLMVSRLSTMRLPLAMPSWHLAMPRLLK